MSFIDDAIRTKSDKFYGEDISFDQFDAIISDYILVGSELDKIKKHMFYGKKTDYSPEAGEDSMHDANNIVHEDIIHGILGVATESVELCEALSASLDCGLPVDAVNVKEEMGDIFWYLAILANRLDISFEDVQTTVINKLKARYPDKFTENDAVNRDLDLERKILEQ